MKRYGQRFPARRQVIRPRIRKNSSGMNKEEALLGSVLAAMAQSGIIDQGIMFEDLRFKVGIGNEDGKKEQWYKPDFAFTAGERLFIAEHKGEKRVAEMNRYKAAAGRYPWIIWFLSTYQKGQGFTWEPFHPSDKKIVDNLLAQYYGKVVN